MKCNIGRTPFDFCIFLCYICPQIYDSNLHTQIKLFVNLLEELIYDLVVRIFLLVLIFVIFSVVKILKGKLFSLSFVFVHFFSMKTMIKCFICFLVYTIIKVQQHIFGARFSFSIQSLILLL